MNQTHKEKIVTEFYSSNLHRCLDCYSESSVFIGEYYNDCGRIPFYVCYLLKLLLQVTFKVIIILG